MVNGSTRFSMMNHNTAAWIFLRLIFSELMPAEAIDTGTSLGLADSDPSGQETSVLLRQKIRILPAVQEKLPPFSRSLPNDPKIFVEVCYNVFSVLEVDDTQQTIQIIMHAFFTWRDPTLGWNSSMYNGEDWIEFDASSLWTPKIIIANSVETQNSAISEETVTIRSDGQVTMVALINFQILCAMELKNYPFDKQACPVYFYSLSPQKVEWTLMACNDTTDTFMKGMIQCREWMFLGVSSYITEYKNRTFPVIEVHVRRKSDFYVVCLVLPMVLTSYTNSLVFVLPLQSGERLSFLVTIFVSTSVFTSLFSDTVPRGSVDHQLPNIMQLFIGVLSESILILLLTILISRRYHHEQEVEEVRNVTSKLQQTSFKVDLASAVTSASVNNGSRNSVTPLSEETEEQKIPATLRTSSACKVTLTSKLMNKVCFIFSLLLKTVFLIVVFWPPS